MSTPAHREARRKLSDYLRIALGAETPMPLEMDEVERLAIDLAKAAEDAQLVRHGVMSDRHRLDRMQAAEMGISFLTPERGGSGGWAAHTERCGWCAVKPTVREAIDAALDGLKKEAE